MGRGDEARKGDPALRRVVQNKADPTYIARTHVKVPRLLKLETQLIHEAFLRNTKVSFERTGAAVRRAPRARVQQSQTLETRLCFSDSSRIPPSLVRTRWQQEEEGHRVANPLLPSPDHGSGVSH